MHVLRCPGLGSEDEPFEGYDACFQRVDACGRLTHLLRAMADVIYQLAERCGALLEPRNHARHGIDVVSVENGDQVLEPFTFAANLGEELFEPGDLRREGVVLDVALASEPC